MVGIWRRETDSYISYNLVQGDYMFGEFGLWDMLGNKYINAAYHCAFMTPVDIFIPGVTIGFEEPYDPATFQQTALANNYGIDVYKKFAVTLMGEHYSFRSLSDDNDEIAEILEDARQLYENADKKGRIDIDEVINNIAKNNEVDYRYKDTLLGAYFKNKQ